MMVALFFVLTVTAFPVDTLTNSSPGFYILVLTAGCAAGLQTAALTKAGGVNLRTTYVSGVLTTAAVSIVQIFLSHEREARRLARRQASVVGRLWCFYVLGGAMGSFCFVRVGTWGLLLPIIWLITLAAVRRAPTPHDPIKPPPGS